MNYTAIKKYDIANLKGLRTSIWFSGCNGFNGQHCKGCFNQDLWSFKSGKPFTEDVKKYVFETLADEHTKGRLSILGGEPLQQNLDEMLSFVKEVKEKFPKGNIALWTGYYLDELTDKQREIIKYCDYVIDGRFEENLTTLNLKFKGSSNQTIWKNMNGKFVVSELN